MAEDLSFRTSPTGRATLIAPEGLMAEDLSFRTSPTGAAPRSLRRRV